jgi:transketolase
MSQACSAAEMLSALYTQIMNLDKSEGAPIPEPFNGVPGPDNKGYVRGSVYNGKKAPDKDIFIFSPSHYGLVLYATLIETGRMDPAGLEQFNKDGSVVEMISAEHSPGVETTTGSLGQAISQAGGMALGRKLLGESGKVWVMMTDGEFQEGEIWEAVMTMAHYKLDNVGVYVDVNGQQCDGAMKDVMTIGDLRLKLESFGAKAVDVDGHNIEKLVKPAKEKPDGRPLFVLAKTNPVYKLCLMEERAPKLHYLRFTSDDEKRKYEEAFKTMKEEIQNGTCQ